MVDPLLQRVNRKKESAKNNNNNKNSNSQSPSCSEMISIAVYSYIYPFLKAAVSTLASFIHKMFLKAYDAFLVADNYYGYLTDRAPEDAAEFEAWQKRKSEQQKENAWKKKSDARKASLKEQYELDKARLSRTKDTCTNWHNDAKSKLDEKKKFDESLYVEQKNREKPHRTPGWEPEKFEHSDYERQLCDNLECTSKSKLKLPELPGSNSKKCNEEVVKRRHFEAELDNCQAKFDNTVEYYEELLAKLKNDHNKNMALLPGPNSAVELIESSPPIQDLGKVSFWSKILGVPINIIQNGFVQKPNSIILAPIAKIFDLFMAAIVCCAYFMILCFCAIIIYHAINYSYDSLKHWTKVRREEREYYRQKQREDEEFERQNYQKQERQRQRKKSRKELGRAVDRVLDGTAKKTVALVRTLKGGYIVPNLCEFDLADINSLTEAEKQQLTFAADPIHAVIKFEKIRLEMQELLELNSPTDLYKIMEKSTKKNRFKSILSSISIKRSRFNQLQNVGSTITGTIAILMVTALPSVPKKKPIYDSQPSVQIVQNTIKESTNIQSNLSLDKLEEIIDIEKQIYTEAQLANEARRDRLESMRDRYKRRKEESSLRKIHTLLELQKRYTKDCKDGQVTYTIREETDKYLVIERIDGDDIEKIILELSNN